MSLAVFFFICLLAGVLYAIIAAVWGGVGGGDHIPAGTPEVTMPGDVPGADTTITSAEVAGEMHFSPMSPAVIATFVASFGAAGLVCTNGFHLGAFPSVTIATIAGLGMGAVAFWLFHKLYSATQSSSEATVDTLVGLSAEIITPIGKGQVGEIAYVARGTRYTAPARAETGVEIPKGATVKIARIVGNTFYVKTV